MDVIIIPDGAPICCCGETTPTAGCCENASGDVYAKFENICGPTVNNPVLLTQNHSETCPDGVSDCWFGTLESGGDCDAHINVYFYCLDGKYHLHMDGWLNDGYMTPVVCGADAQTTDCDCLRVTFSIACEGCCSEPLLVTIYQQGCY